MQGYFEADRFLRCPRCGEDRLARVPGMGLFEAEVRWLGPECAVHGEEVLYGIVALMWRPHRCNDSASRDRAEKGGTE
jgi:hypothetical protein